LKSLRSAEENVAPYDDGSGYGCTIRAEFDDEKKPRLILEAGGDRIHIDAS